MLAADFDDEDFDEPDPDFGLSSKEMGMKKRAFFKRTDACFHIVRGEKYSEW